MTKVQDGIALEFGSNGYSLVLGLLFDLEAR